MSNQTELLDWVFNLHNQDQGISRTLAEGLTARIFAGENVMLSIVRVEPNSAGTRHHHVEEQWGVLLEGECIRIQGDDEFHAKAGDFWHTPSNVPHSIRTGDTGAVILDIFGPPRPEYRKTGAGFGQATTE